MSETPVPRLTRGYVFFIWTLAILIGAGAGAGLGVLTRNVWVGIVSGVAVIALVGFSSMLSARREGRGTFEAAPPWTGDAGVRHHNGGSV
ncbi:MULTISPECIES: hypothetical protein [unclassified Microbacterium]|uniref:hypothetical protein n=1 Tax=unclassified Microbacterium TaxID=2609290 RepID=UPI0036577B57